MTHADPENEAHGLSRYEVGAAATGKALENPTVQEKLKSALVEGGMALRQRAETEGTRQNLVKKLLDAMTPEAQKEFVTNTQSFLHKCAETVKNQGTGGLRSMWKTLAPSLLPADWISLESFNEDEVLGYIAIGAVHVEEETAHLVDGITKNHVKMLRTMGFLVSLTEVGAPVGATLGGMAQLAEAPAAFLEKVLPEVREAVNNGGVITQTVQEKHEEIEKDLPEYIN